MHFIKLKVTEVKDRVAKIQTEDKKEFEILSQYKCDDYIYQFDVGDILYAQINQDKVFLVTEKNEEGYALWVSFIRRKDVLSIDSIGTTEENYNEQE